MRKSTALVKRAKRAPRLCEVWAVGSDGHEECISKPMSRARARGLVEAASGDVGDVKLEVRSAGAAIVVRDKGDVDVGARIGRVLEEVARWHKAVAPTYERGQQTPVAVGPLTRALTLRLAESERVRQFAGDVIGEIGRLMAGR